VRSWSRASPDPLDGLGEPFVPRRSQSSEHRGTSANALVGAVGPLVGGRGGGKDDVAQGGGSDASRVDEALDLVRSEVDRSVDWSGQG